MDNKQGEKRQKPGRKKGVTFKEPTKVVTFRVPVSVYRTLKMKFGRNLSDIIRDFLMSKIDS